MTREARGRKTTPPTPARGGMAGFVQDAVDDIRAVRRGDPAARSFAEVVAAYPGLHALWMHRFAHRLWNQGHRFAARALSHYSRHITGVEIHPGAVIGRRVFIDHGMGVVIGETAVIGDDCLIYKGVVLGGTTLTRSKRHPTIGKGVVIGSNACILGALEIGDGARVGSGSVVIKDVDEGATVVGIPGRSVSKEIRKPVESPDLAHHKLPDPMQRIVKDLVEHIEGLSSRLRVLESLVEISPEELAERLKQHKLQDALEQEFVETFQDSSLDGEQKKSGTG